jgi:hypothetical protein
VDIVFHIFIETLVPRRPWATREISYVK